MSVNEWLGELKLSFNFCNGRTILSRYSHYGPFVVQRLFYHESNLPHVYLLHPPGGLVGGDKLVLNVNLARSSQALLTMPSATKIYRSKGPYVIIDQQFTLAQDSSLEWFPRCNILFPRAKVIMNTVFLLEKGSRLIGCNTLCFGRPVLQEKFKEGELDSKLRISLFSDLGLEDRLRINTDSLDKIGGYQIHSIFFAIPSDQEMLDQIRLYLKISNVKICGVTLLDKLLIIRLLDNDNRLLNQTLCHVWAMIRSRIIGYHAVFPRIWFT